MLVRFASTATGAPPSRTADGPGSRARRPDRWRASWSLAMAPRESPPMARGTLELSPATPSPRRGRARGRAAARWREALATPREPVPRPPESGPRLIVALRGLGQREDRRRRILERD